MIPIVSPLLKPNTILKSMPLNLGATKSPAEDPEHQSSLVEQIDPAKNCSHVVAQTSRTLLKFLKVERDAHGKEMHFEPLLSMPIYSRIFYLSKISEKR